MITTRGFTAFKLHAGNGVAEDADSVAQLRRALPTAMLLLDGHWRYTLDEAVTLGHKLEALDAALFEAPLNPEDIDGHARLAQAVALLLRLLRWTVLLLLALYHGGSPV